MRRRYLQHLSAMCADYTEESVPDLETAMRGFDPTTEGVIHFVSIDPDTFEIWDHTVVRTKQGAG